MTTVAREVGTSIAMLERHYAGVISDWDGRKVSAVKEIRRARASVAVIKERLMAEGPRWRVALVDPTYGLQIELRDGTRLTGLSVSHTGVYLDRRCVQVVDARRPGVSYCLMPPPTSSGQLLSHAGCTSVPYGRMMA